ncbi:MAG: DUF1501 domain-containing protein [Proteobacteria bacterium]|nr:DUF1501 domain-containing protein [Pseudomonadota bacterium]
MITRRKFLQGTTAFFTLAGTGLTLGISNTKGGSLANEKSLVHLFFRGGMDPLNFLIPRTGINRSEYETKRPNIQVPVDLTLDLNGAFGLPSTCSELHQLYQQGKMAMIHSVGMPDGTGSRSHFESEKMFDFGIPGDSQYPTGWLARHINSSPNINSSAVIPSMTPGTPSLSHQGDRNVFSIPVGDNNVQPNSGRYAEEHMTTLRNMYDGTDTLDNAMQATLDNISIITGLDLTIPDSYPSGSLAQSLGLIAALIKSDLGLQIASLNFGGWDTHENSGNSGTGNYIDRLGRVSAAIGAFFADLTAAGKDDQVVLTTQTEFGRRVRENGNRGTDHGTGSAMMVIGGAVSGGYVFGHFPGITDDDLYLNTDLRMTTDFRRPLSDVLTNFLDNPNISEVFPGYTGSTNMGLFTSDEIFANGFE